MTSPDQPRSSRSRAANAAAPRRVLFFGEGSTLAHAARPLALAAALPQDRYETVVAVPERYRRWAAGHIGLRPLQAQSPEAFAQRLRSGKPLFSKARLEEYLAEDLAHIEAVKPHIIVGDFRLSLAASARLATTPYISISNAYWRPGRPIPPLRPILDMFHRWPRPAADLAYRLLLPAALAWHAKPVDQLLTGHGLGGIDGDVRRAFTEADLTLYADLPGLFPDLQPDERQAFLGPVPWEPPSSLPDWWDEVPDDRPVAYVTLGSSGAVEGLERMVGWLIAMGYTVLVATAERAQLQGDGKALFVADYLPGLAASERADVVVCNGGAPTAAQALLHGRPVLGIVSNVDQFLNMRAVQAAGAGACLRADAIGRGRFESAVNRLAGFRASKAAARLAATGAGVDAAQVLSAAIDRLAPG
jgi:UDP:flavonoid glycosyltransferase YjiC (YdhE family)